MDTDIMDTNITDIMDTNIADIMDTDITDTKITDITDTDIIDIIDTAILRIVSSHLRPMSAKVIVGSCWHLDSRLAPSTKTGKICIR